MNVWNWIKQTPLWLVVPSVFLAAGVATAVTHYEPLVFDPSLYEVQQANAAELETIDAEALEAANAADQPPADVELASASTVASVTGTLADGTWTGYAACGQGNPDGWKPYYVGVTVTVGGGSPQGIGSIFGSSTGNSGSVPLSWDAAENQKYLDWAISGRNGTAGVQSQLAGQSIATGIDAVSGATYSSAAIYNAYIDALGKAAEAAGGQAPTAKVQPEQVKPAKKSEAVKSKKKVGKLADGTFTAYAQCGPDPDDDWKPYYIGVTLKVKGGSIKSITKIFGSSKGEKGMPKLVYDADENGQYFDSARFGVGVKLEKAAAAGKVLGGVDTVSGATFSSKAMYEAYFAALQKSAKKAGASAVEVDDDTDADADDSGAGQEEDQDQQDADESESYYGYARCENLATSSDSWDPYYLFVEVKATDGAVTRVARVFADTEGLVDPDCVYSAAQNALYLNWAIDGKFGGQGYRMKSVVVQIQEKIAAGIEVSGISTVSGATRSSRAIVEAYEMAAANAAAGVGTTPEEAVQLATGSSDPATPLVPGTPVF